MDQNINFNEFKKEAKKKERKEWFQKKKENTVKWINDNKEFLAIAIPAGATIISGTAKGVKAVSRNIALKQEKEMKEKFIYDRSLGRYLELKKPLSNAQLKRILERKENGEKLGSILQQMNLLR